MKISDFLLPADVLIGVRATQKRQLLKELAQKIAQTTELSQELISSELLKREDLGSTGTGGGIAIPHARVLGLEKPRGLVARLKQPIDFELYRWPARRSGIRASPPRNCRSRAVKCPCVRCPAAQDARRGLAYA